MTIYRNSAEGGTSGTPVTVANSGGASGYPIALSSVTNAWEYHTSAAKAGSLGFRRTLDTTGPYLRWDDTGASGRVGAGRWIYYYGAPPSSVTFIQVRTAADGLCANLLIHPDGEFRLAPAGTQLSASDSPTLTPNTWYWCELYVTHGTTTSNGRVEMRILESDGSTLFHYYDTGFTVNAGTAQPVRFRMGGFGTTSSGWTYDLMDEVAYGGIGTGDFMGPVDTGGTSISVDYTQEMRQYIDFSGTSGASNLVLSLTQTGGPTVALSHPAGTMVASFVDSMARDSTIYFDYTITGDGAPDATGEVQFLPPGTSVSRVGPLVYDGEDWL